MILKDILDKLDPNREGTATILLWFPIDDETEIRTDSVLLNVLGKYEVDFLKKINDCCLRVALKDHEDFMLRGEE